MIDMISIHELVEHIPDGKKIEYLGKSYVSAITLYHDNYTDEFIDINELVADNFSQLILKDKIIKDLLLFENEKLAVICKRPVERLTELSTLMIRKKIISYYGFEYEIDDIVKQDPTTKSICQATLHDFQERIRRKVINLIFNGQKRFLIHMPTGSGKTRTAAEIIIDFVRLSSSKALLNDNIKVLWIAQSSELCIQAYETINWLFNQKGTKDIEFGHFYENHELSADLPDKPAIIFCSIQKLLIHYKEPIWSKIRNNNYLVVVDEAHRSVAERWIKALDYFVSNSSVYLLGLTATPGLGDGSDSSNYNLSTYYQSNKISLTDSNYTELSKPIHYLVEREFLADIERIDIDSFTKVSDEIEKSSRGEFKFTKKTLKELSVSASRNSSILNIIRTNFEQGKKILVFTCGLEHNRILKSLLEFHNINSETVDQSTKNRQSIISRFKSGDLMILLNYGVLTTGFDAPKTDVCIIARPIESIVMYSQMVGRILRGPNNKGNKNNILYTIKDNLDHGDYDSMFNSFNEFYK
ncbi:DEAD/DEAH box helicase [Maribellus mangrovi]|uniref:DEAD/DEAH box helicase n=1 Tax=Maribellus mangrovi TaxID=3133146 RepID=UPI0030ED2C32